MIDNYYALKNTLALEKGIFSSEHFGYAPY
jgi:hypothetical protein